MAPDSPVQLTPASGQTTRQEVCAKGQQVHGAQRVWKWESGDLSRAVPAGWWQQVGLKGKKSVPTTVSRSYVVKGINKAMGVTGSSTDISDTIK